MGDLEGKTAIITGGSRGLGEADARLFARHGARILICDLLDDQGESLARELRGTGAEVSYHHLDVTDEQGWADVAVAVADLYGGADILVNNAGIGGPKDGVMSYSLKDFVNCINVNVVGMFLGIKEVAPLMRLRGGGSIINMSSVGGMHGYHNVGYGVAKRGVIALTESAALELANWGIRVNAICPGITESPVATGTAVEVRVPGARYENADAEQRAQAANRLNYDVVAKAAPMQRPGRASEVAELALFLASDRSSYLTGEHIANDGGLASGGLFGTIGRTIGSIEPYPVPVPQ
jgi:3alpha(or 20beta)-hydroxysteroid dehydrogenase